MRDVMAALPPKTGQAERQLGEPNEREGEHPEQHPRTDTPRRRLTRETRAAPRVDGEDREQHDLRQDPVDLFEPPVAGRAGNLVCTEERPHPKTRQVQISGDDAAVPEE